ncbi:MAG: DUF4313 domain-containing protein [Lachnospiraceae bacterium]|nr:DUF4313 domain-containing protein [Lachnospiraceae bacterium]
MEKKLKLDTSWGDTMEVSLEINSYLSNKGLYIGIVSECDGYSEPYGDLTVNLADKAPDYCGYVDVNNMPELEQFIQENELGEFTGLTQRSGFVEYPLYLFDVEKLRELCPDGIAEYEANIGKARVPQTKELSR